MLKVSNLIKIYHTNYEVKVLNRLSFELGENKTGVIYGSSGAGKSTLLHIIGTLDTADRGEIIINRVNILKLNGKKKNIFRNREIGFVFQKPNLIMELSAIENTALPLLIRGIEKKQAIKRAEEMLVRTGLKDRLYHKPFELSGGEAQRVNLSRALVGNPSLILADEPTGNLDYSSRDDIIELLSSISSEFKITMLIVSHDRIFFKIADRKFLLNKGVISIEN